MLLEQPLLAKAVTATVYTSVRESPVRRYLKGFSDAVLPETVNAQLRSEVIRFHLRANLSRATSAFFTTPEIK
jgi:hypothetical protein